MRPGDIVVLTYTGKYKLTRDPGWATNNPIVGQVTAQDVCLVISTAWSQFGLEALVLCNHGGTLQLGWQVASRFEGC